MLTILNELGQTVALLENDGSDALTFYQDKIQEKLNDAYLTLNFRTAARRSDGTMHQDAEQLVGGHGVIFPDKEGTLQAFTIKTVEEVEETDGTIAKEIYAEHLALELNGILVRPQTFTGLNAEQYISQIITGTRWKLGEVEWFGIQDIKIDEYTSGIQAIIKGAEQFGGEFKFRAVMSGGRLTGLYVDLVEQRGQPETGIIIESGHNLKTVKRTEDISQIYTALVGLARGTQDSSDEGYLTFANVQASDKPLGQDFIGNSSALQQYGIPLADGNRAHYMGVYLYEGNENVTPTRLLELTRQKLKEVSVPKYTYETTFQDLANITGYELTKFKIGDTIAVKNLDFSPPLLVSARIIEYDYSSDEKDGNVILGDYRDIWKESQVSAIDALRKTVMKEAGKWEAGIAWQEARRIAWRASASVSVDEVTARKEALDEQKARVTASPRLVDAVIKNWITAASNDLNTAHADYINLISAASVAGEITEEEQEAITQQRSVLAASESQLIEALQAAETNIQENGEAAAVDAAETAAQEAARTTVSEFAEKKIFRGPAYPSDPAPVANDLWIDTSGAKPIWKQYIGGVWIAITRTNINEMLGTLSSQQLADNAVTAAKIVNGAISELKLADAAVTGLKIADGAVAATKIVDGAISELKLAADAVTAAKLAANAVTEGKIAAGAVTAGKIEAGAVIAEKIAAGAITTAKLAAGAVTANEIAAGAITTGKLAAGAVTANEIAADAIIAGKIAAGAITTAKLAAGAVTANEIATDAITAVKIAAGAIGTDKLAANAITAGKIAAGAITTSHISAAGIDAGVLTANSIIAANITFKGTLSGATGTFSGTVQVGNISNTFAEIVNGTVSVRKTNTSGVVTEALLASGGLYLKDSTYQSSVVQSGQALYITPPSGGWVSIASNNVTVGSLDSYGYTDISGDFTARAISRFYGNTNIYAALYAQSSISTDASITAATNAFIGGRLAGSTLTADVQVSGTYTALTETGICGTGAMQNGTSNTGAFNGIYVQFRNRKSYTPSSITISGRSSNLTASTQVATTDITNYGFWLYLNMTSAGNTFRYWRGSYSA